MKLRLLITSDCNRSCQGCCNKQWDLLSLPIADPNEDYEMIMLTGGEPLMDSQVYRTIEILRNMANRETTLIVYTALSRNVPMILNLVDGVTLTLHDQNDVDPFLELNEYLLRNLSTAGLSMRLNVFKGVSIPKGTDLSRWKVKSNIVWLENCPLPKDEVFMRYE